MDKESFLNFNSSNQLILLCSRPRIDRSQGENIEKIISNKSFSWEQLLNNAFKNSILPYVYFHLKTLALLSKIPDEVREKLEKFYYFNTARNAWILLSLEKIAEVFNQKGIAFILIQGASLLADVYSNHSLRYLSDIDIFLKKEHLGGIEDIISPLGWKMSDNPGDKKWCMENLNHLPLFFRPGEPVPLEIHFKLSYPEGTKDMGSDWIWEKSCVEKIRSARITIPSPENIILHLSMHIFKKSHINDLTILLRHCCDISAILERYRGRINIDGLVLTAKETGLCDPLYHSLKVSNSLIRESFLEQVISKISENISEDIREFSEYVETCLARPDESIKVPLNGLELFFIQKGFFKKIIFLFNHILFPSLDLIEKGYGVSKSSKKIYLYYFLRPFLMASRFTWKRAIMAYRLSKIKNQNAKL